MKWCFFVLALILIFNVFISKTFAEERSYEYSSINADITIQKDSTVRVEEYQKFLFSGTFHQGWREIPLKHISEISDISVFDSKNQKELEYSRGRLNKENENSWGKYTTFKENGKQIIEWYYNASNEEREWVIRYTVHGSIQFLREQTRFYWNVFTGYTVPIKSSTIVVKLPNEIDASGIVLSSYRAKDKPIAETRTDSHTLQFSASDFSPWEAFTVDVGWSKGIPSLGSFIKDLIKLNFGYIASFFIFLIAFIIGLVHWLKGKKREKGRGTIIPEYEPPENIPPIFAEAIMKERTSPKGFAATVVSLAVRGYIKINEDPKGRVGVFFEIIKAKKVTIFIAVMILGVILIPLFFQTGVFSLRFVVFMFFYVFFFGFVLQALLATKGKPYILELIKPIDDGMYDFEKRYIEVMFENKKIFSFRELKKDQEKQREFSQEMTKIEDDISKELDIKTNAFANGGIQKEKFMVPSFIGAFGIMVLGTVLGDKIFSSDLIVQLWTIILSFVSASFALWGFMKFEAELSEKGIEMRQKLLGFKMFLSVTEKDRMKNLTPEMFEKYLPYAMIFGVEKQWSKTFEGMHVPPPKWYGATPVMGAVSGSMNPTFSPVSFSNSFSSAFTSAFTSAGGAGAGSGGAGGGGGGGGGGAS